MRRNGRNDVEDLRSLLKKAVGESLPDEDQELIDRLVDVACGALESGGNADTIRDAVTAEADSSLKEAESALLDAENIIKAG